MRPAIVSQRDLATAARQSAQAAVLDAAEARGRLLVASGVTGTDPLDEAAARLYRALVIERLMR